MKKKKGFLWLLAVVGLVLLKFLLGKIIVATCLYRWFTLEQLKMYSMLFKDYVQTNHLTAVLLYVAIYTATIAVGVPSVPLLSLLGGFAFGFLPGVIYGTVGATAGSVIAFAIVRYFLRDWIRRRYAERYKHFNDHLEKYGASYLLSVHFSSVIPFFFINTLAALTNISWWTFVWTTVVGFIPLGSVYTFAGRQLSSVTSVHDILSWPIITALVILIIAAILPVVIRYMRNSDELIEP